MEVQKQQQKQCLVVKEAVSKLCEGPDPGVSDTNTDDTVHEYCQFVLVSF